MVRFSPFSPDLPCLAKGGADHGQTMKLMLPAPGQEQAGMAVLALPQHQHPRRQLLPPTTPESQQGENFSLFFLLL